MEKNHFSNIIYKLKEMNMKQRINPVENFNDLIDAISIETLHDEGNVKLNKINFNSHTEWVTIQNDDIDISYSEPLWFTRMRKIVNILED